MKNLFLGLTLLSLSFSTLASEYADNASLFELFKIDSDSGIKGPPYDTIISELKNLAKKYPQKAEVITYGKTVQNRPLTVIKISHKNVPAKSNKAVYIGGSIHGNEYLNIEDRLPKWILEQSSGSVVDFLNQGGVFYIAPILNPDGYEARERENTNGVDLNRDYTVVKANVVGFKQPETKSLVTYLKEDLARSNKKLAIGLDYHCCIGALLYPWSFTGPVISATDKKAHEDIAKIMHQALGTIVRSGTTPTILGYSATGTSKDFYYEMGALGFTYEGRRNMEDKFFDEHTTMWSEIIKKFLQ